VGVEVLAVRVAMKDLLCTNKNKSQGERAEGMHERLARVKENRLTFRAVKPSFKESKSDLRGKTTRSQTSKNCNLALVKRNCGAAKK